MNTWRVADLSARRLLLLEGLGWGTLPLPLVREDLEAGRLVHLDLPDFKGGPYRFFAIHRIDSPPGPAARSLLDRFAAQVRPMHDEDEIGSLPAHLRASARSARLPS